jgi:ribosomal protein L12E/L44/L45/RPP1/RPP2
MDVAHAAGQLAVTYAVLLLHDGGAAITPDKIEAVLKAAHVKVECYWDILLCRVLEFKTVPQLLLEDGGGDRTRPPPEPVEEEEEESFGCLVEEEHGHGAWSW